MKNIICAIDYSENAITALKYAYSITKKLKSKLLVTHVFNYPTVLGGEFQMPYQDIEEHKIQEELLKLKDFCQKHLGDGLNKENVTFEVLENSSVVKALVSKAEEIDAYMIVAGMKGKSVIKDIFMGNTTRHLIDKAPCLVLAVPEDFYYSNIKTIVYATDFELNEDIEVIEKLTSIAKAFDANIDVVHISTKKEYAAQAQMDWFKNELKKKVTYKKIGFNVVYSDDVFERLRVYAGDLNADLIIMLEREKSDYFKNLFHQDLVKKMEIYGKIPLISFNEQNFGLLHFLKLS